MSTKDITNESSAISSSDKSAKMLSPREMVVNEFFAALFGTIIRFRGAIQEHISDEWSELRERDSVIPDKSFSASTRDTLQTSYTKIPEWAKAGQSGSKLKLSRIWFETGEEQSYTTVPLISCERIMFFNGNIYEGHAYAGGLMHGKGSFFWEDSTVYHGDFKNGYPTGEGIMTLQDQCKYKGEVCEGYFHGQGVLDVVSTPLFYNGYWKSGKRHGTGWLVYGHDNWYDGEWYEHCKEGYGTRQYNKSTVYKGDWVKNKKIGNATIVWSNHDYYCGQVKNDYLHGYGEYFWNVVYNDSFSFPSYNCYKGSWKFGKRHGVGMMNFGTDCGARLIGTWNNNEKHGPGVMICGNGKVISSNPIFLNDVPIQKKQQKTLRQLIPDYDIKFIFREVLSIIKKKEYMEKFPPEIIRYITYESMMAPVDPFLKIEDPHFPNKEPLYYLELPIHTITENVDLDYYLDLVLEQYLADDSNSWSNLSLIYGLHEEKSKLLSIKCISKAEKTFLTNIIIVHLPELREIYHHYAKFTDKPLCPGVKPVLIRLFLWQLLRDIQLYYYASLYEADLLFSQNPACCAETDHYPFEQIYFWQFLQYLVGCAWLVHSAKTQYFNIQPIMATTGIVACVFKSFLIKDVLPYYKSHQGMALKEYKDTVSLKSAYNFYVNLGEPLRVGTFLLHTCMKQGAPPCYYKSDFFQEPLSTIQGYNTVPIGDSIYYVKTANDDDFVKQLDDTTSTPREFKDVFYRSLYTFRALGKKKIIKSISTICPKVIIELRKLDMNYKIIFLEFYEIILQCAHEKADMIREREDPLKVSADTIQEASSVAKRENKKRKSKKSIYSTISQKM